MSSNRQVDPMFNRRAIMAAGGGALLFGGLIARLFQLQILNREKYQLAAADNSVKLELAPPQRGQILDRFGRSLASHRRAGRISVVPEQSGDLSAVLQKISQYIDLPRERQDRILSQARRQAAFQPVIVARELSYEDFARMSLRAPQMPGVLVEMASTRSYPRGRDFAHVLGYVSRASNDYIFREAFNTLNSSRDRKLDEALAKEFSGIRMSRQLRQDFFLTHPDEAGLLRAFHDTYGDVATLLKHRDMRAGRSGIELRAEAYLRGKSGFRRLETNAAGRIIRELPSEDLAPVPGRDLYLTVDAELQKFAIDRFGGESGAAVVLDIDTGDLLAFVSTPAFDPNDFVNGISQADYDKLRFSDRYPLYHKAYDGTYPPGSTFKMVVATAALEAGIIDPEERVHCNGRYHFGNNTWHCWRRQGHGSVNMHSAIKGSCDVYFYEIARRMGIETLAETAKEFGFGQSWDLGLTGGRQGVVPNNAWKLEAQGEPWYEGETLNIGIGQGQLSATPLQLAVMTARIAAEGRLINPQIIGIGPKPGADIPGDKPLDRARMQRMKAGMFGVTSEAGGTALRAGDLGLGGPRLAGKTGTAQVRRISAAERRSGILKGEEIDRRLRDHALFVAYAPHDDPKYAISVIVEHGEGGSRTAAPIARDILAEALRQDSRRAPNYVQTAALAPGRSGGGGS